MELVLLTALGVGGATVFGTVLGFVFKKISHRFSDIVLSFAAGVMLAAGVVAFFMMYPAGVCVMKFIEWIRVLL